MPRLVVAAAILLSALAFAAASLGAGGEQGVLGVGADAQLTNYVPSVLTTQRAKALRERWSVRLDGSVVASPLYLASEPVAGSHGAVYVATEANSVYALRPTDGSTLWHASLGRTVRTCGGAYGISSSPVIDGKRHLLYAIGANGLLTALDTRTGKTAPGWPIRLVRRVSVEYVWGGLRLLGNTLYVGVASYCDKPDAHGRAADGSIVAVDRISRRVVHTLDVVPGPDNMGGVWGWGGIAIDPGGRTLYTATGNAEVVRGGDLVEDAPYGERVLRLTPSLKVTGAWRAPDRPIANAGDVDFGAAPVLFRPPGCPPLMAVNSKNGYTYVWNRRTPGAKPLFRARLGSDDPDDPFIGHPAYVPSARMLVVGAASFTDDAGDHRGLVSYSVDAGCRFHPAWSINVGGGQAAPPLVAGQVVLVHAPAAGLLVVADVRTGETLFTPQVGLAYAPVLVAGPRVISGAMDGTVRAFS